LQPPWPSDEVGDVSCREGFFRKDFLEWSSWLLRQQGGRLAKRPLNPSDAKEFMKQETISNSLTVYICIQKQYFLWHAWSVETSFNKPIGHGIPTLEQLASSLPKIV